MWSEFLSDLEKYGLFRVLRTLSLTIVPAVAAVVVVYHLLMRMRAEDEYTAAQHTRSIRNTVVFAAILMASGPLLHWVVSTIGIGSDSAWVPCHGYIWDTVLVCPHPVHENPVP
ncbi:MAG: hypothetical protein AB2385_05985 [Symbiobacterium sp.]|uniref:hypothetical protein n=1 Tax=Symbiobacterium sp. TaxID=1971213 RepID=UPI00346448E4